MQPMPGIRKAAGGAPAPVEPLAVSNRDTETWFFDDFLGMNLSNPEIMPGWTDTIGVGSSITTYAGADNVMGALRLIANNSNLTLTNFSKNMRVLGAGDAAFIEWRLIWTGVRPVGAGYIRFDMYDNAQNWYRFEMLPGAGNWFLEGEEGGIQRFRIDTGNLPANGVPIRLAILGHDDQVEFLINGISIHTHAVPLGVLNNNTFYCRISMNHGAVSNVEIILDWVLMSSVLASTPRTP